MLGAAASIIRGPSYSAFIVYGAVLLGAIGSRHLNVIFFVWLPLTLIGIASMEKLRRFSTGEKTRNRGKAAGTAFLNWCRSFLAERLDGEIHEISGWSEILPHLQPMGSALGRKHT